VPWSDHGHLPPGAYKRSAVHQQVFLYSLSSQQASNKHVFHIVHEHRRLAYAMRTQRNRQKESVVK